MAKGQRDRAKERHWRGHLAAWRRSGQSVRAYCAAQGLSEPSFYAWRRVLLQRDGRSGIKVAPGATSPSAALAGRSPFVPVRLVEEATSAASVEVVLRGGRVVRVAAGFTAQTLREVVAALEDLPC
jgi:transposase